MPEKMNFTQTRIRGIKPPKKKGARDTYHDIDQPKLVLRVSDTGNKSFSVVKKDTSGKTKRVAIGKFPDVSVDDARKVASKILSEIHSGVDPNEEKKKKRQKSKTLEKLLNEYIDSRRQKLKPITVSDYRQKMNWGFSDWMKKPASNITKQMVITRHKNLSDRPTACNGAFRPLRAVLNYAVAVEAIEGNPVDILKLAKTWHKDKRRTDIIHSSQLGEWIQAVERIEPKMHRTAFLMMLYMGFRITETYKLEWRNVDLENELLLQRDTKNGTDHELPIPSPIIPLIHELKGQTGEGQYLFPAVRRDSFHGRPKRQIKQINDAISFDFTPHTARHTFTTIAEAVGISKTMINRLTNHTTDSDVTGGYIHTEIETLREAINKIAAYIQAKITSDGKVVKLYG